MAHAKRGSSANVKFLDATPCGSFRNGQTGLHLAAVADRAESIAALIQHEAKTSNIDRNGMTPLHLAAVYGSARAVEALLEANANPDATLPDRLGRPYPARVGPPSLAGSTALHLAALVGNTNIISLLLNAGASVNATNATGRTALDMALHVPNYYFEISRLRLHSNSLWNVSSPSAIPSPASIAGTRPATTAVLEKAGGKRSTTSGFYSGPF